MYAVKLSLICKLFC